MIIDDITIYKTPLTPDYSNVIDVIGENANKKSKLSEVLLNYPYRTYTTPSVRTVKRSNNGAIIVLREFYEDIRDFNYCSILDDYGNHYFYFITSITSENDGTNSKASQLTLQWDAWNNNIDKFTICNNTIETSHFDRFDIQYGAYDDVTGVIPKFYYDKLNFDCIKQYDNKNVGDRYIPAFYVLTFKEMAIYPTPKNYSYKKNGLSFELIGVTVDDDPTILQGETIHIMDSLNNRYNRKVVYIFAGLFDTENEEFVDCFISGKEFTYKYLGNGGTYKYDTSITPFPFGYISRLSRFSLPDEFYTYISNITLSFNCPFKYTINNDELTFTDNSIIPLEYDWSTMTGVSDEWISYVIIGDAKMTDVNGNFEANIRQGAYNEIEKEMNVDRGHIIGYTNLYLDPQSFRVLDINYLEPLSYTPPFSDLKLVCNQETISLIRTGVKDKPFKITTDLNKAQPLISIKCGNERIYSPTDIFMDNSGYFSYGIDSLESFQARNGQSRKVVLQTAVLKGMASIVKTLISKNPMFLAEGAQSVSQLINLRSETIDVDNAPNEWFVNTGECDFKYQDRIRLVVSQVDFNNQSYIEFMNGCYAFGYNYSRFGNVFENTRKSFDYCKTVNCDLSPLLINENDKSELESAFNRGLTKWHILIDNSTYFTPSMIKDKSSTPNYENKFILNSELKEWIGGDL